MSLAAKYLKDHGAKNIIAAAIHLLLVGNADLKLLRSGVDYIYGSNTIENPYSIINIGDVIAANLEIGRAK
jgi:ribose-phosphate pyrophosphokinase